MRMLIILFLLISCLLLCSCDCSTDEDDKSDEASAKSDDDDDLPAIASVEVGDDDDDDNDDNDDDDNDDDDNNDDNDTGGPILEMIDGGNPGHMGVSFSLDPTLALTRHIAAVKASALYVYKIVGDEVVDETCIYRYAWSPCLTADQNGDLHVAFVDFIDYSLVYGTNESGVWEFETIENVGYTTSRPDILIDSSGVKHIVYWDVDELCLKLAHSTSGNWVSENINCVSGLGYRPNMAMDSLGNFHITYNDFNYYTLMYATNKTGTWTNTPMEYVGQGSTSAEIYIDSLDHIHIAFKNNDDEKVVYLTNETGGWISQDVWTAVGGSIGRVSFDMDSLGNAHVVWLWSLAGVRMVQYATNESGSWQKTTIGKSGAAKGKNGQSKGQVFSSECILRMDPFDKVHVVHSDMNRRVIRYAHNRSGSWETYLVDGAGDKGAFSSLVQNSQGKFEVFYYDDVNSSLWHGKKRGNAWEKEQFEFSLLYLIGSGFIEARADDLGNTHLAYRQASRIYSKSDLKYAVNIGDQWQKTVVEYGYLDYVVAANADMELDSSGNPHIAYTCYNQSMDLYDLKYAVLNNGAWEITTIRSNYEYSREIGLALDDNDYAHISVAMEHKLHYVTNESGVWEWEQIDPFWNSGYYNDIAVDGQGSAHIAYSNGDEMYLNYATNANGGVWSSMLLDNAGTVGLFPAIAIDPSGFVHIVHYYNYYSDLKYSTNMTGAWQVVTLSHDGDSGHEPDFMIDRDGYAQVTYHGEGALWKARFPLGYTGH